MKKSESKPKPKQSKKTQKDDVHVIEEPYSQPYEVLEDDLWGLNAFDSYESPVRVFTSDGLELTVRHAADYDHYVA